MQNENSQGIEQWKSDLILEIARTKGFRNEMLEDAHQQLVMVILAFNFDAQHKSGASERTALVSLIHNQLNTILRTERRRQNHMKKIQRVCGPSKYQPFTDDKHIEHERKFELGIDVRMAVSRLSLQEQAACRALSEGKSRCAIAAELGVSRYQVELIVNRVRDVFINLGLDSIQ